MQGFFRMQAIFRLIEYCALRAIHNRVGDLIATHRGRQCSTMASGLAVRAVVIDLEGSELFYLLIGFRLLPHTDPHVSI